MEKAVFDDYVENRYKKQMEYYSKASAKNQKKYRQFQWTLIILSAATPILAALTSRGIGDTGEAAAETGSAGVIGYNTLQIIVVIISGVVAILTAGLKTFSYQELWITYRVTYEKLKPEIHYYHFSVGPYADSGIDKESLFVARVEAMLDAEHTQWPPAKKLQEDQNRQENPPPGGGGSGGGGNDAPPPVGEQAGDVAEPADEALLGEPDEPREIVDESGETDDIAQADETVETDIPGEPGIAEPDEADEDVEPEIGPKQT